jgi:hypothetical protein
VARAVDADGATRRNQSHSGAPQLVQIPSAARHVRDKVSADPEEQGFAMVSCILMEFAAA